MEFWKDLKWTVISGCQIIFRAFIFSTNKIQGPIIFSKNWNCDEKWDIYHNYYKNYISTFQWKWMTIIHDENFEETFMIFMNEWRWPWYWTVQNWFLLMTNTKKRHCVYPLYPTIFRKHVFNLITLEGCLTKKKCYFQSVSS